MALITPHLVSPLDPSARLDRAEGTARADITARVSRTDPASDAGRVRSAASVVVASAALLSGLIAAAYLVQDLLERGLLFMSA